MADKEKKAESGIEDPEKDRFVAELPEKSLDYRKKFYYECSAYALIRYLRENGLAEGSVAFEELTQADYIEKADGIGYVFRVRGTLWGVFLDREEECLKAIQNSPELKSAPEMYVMDVRKAAIGCVNKWYIKKMN